MEELEFQGGIARLPWWHNLMYATSILLVYCGVPATVILAFELSLEGRNGLSGSVVSLLARSDAPLFAVFMIGSELLIAGILYALAEWLARRRKSHR